MGELRSSGFVGDDTLRWLVWPQFLVMVGDIACLGDLVISVEKYLTVVTEDATPGDVLRDGDIQVQTLVYSYNASVRGRGTVFRYDNNHRWKGHADNHHVHRCDWRKDEATGVVQWVGEARWPTLGEVVVELESWYWEARSDLPNPDVHALPLEREPRALWHET
jgi:hypothetical protein